MLHVLPRGFVRIRHYGLLAASCVSTKLAASRHLLDVHAQPIAATSIVHKPAANVGQAPQTASYIQLYREVTGVDLRCCPSCGAAAMFDRPLTPSERAPP
jgi:hypothetical protein